jgi:drug/metabolite transporter (DMT)-like permease
MKAALIKLHIAVFLWGFTGVLGRLISVNEAILVWYRLLITIFSLAIIFSFNKNFNRLNTKQTFTLLAIGSVVGLHWLFFYGSIKYANVSIALVCLSINPLFTSFFEPLITKSKFSWTDVCLSLFGIVGIGLIFHFDSHYQYGIFWGVVSSFFAALFTTLNKKNIGIANADTIMFYELVGAAIMITLIVPFYLLKDKSLQLFPTFNDFIWIVILSWFCTILAMKLSLQALQKVSAFTQNLSLNLEPVYGIVLAFLIFKEQKEVSQYFYYGITLIMLSVLFQMLRIVVKKPSLQHP